MGFCIFSSSRFTWFGIVRGSRREHDDVQTLLPAKQCKNERPLLGGSAAIEQRVPWAMRLDLGIRLQLNVTNRPVEQSDRSRYILQTFAVGPTRNVAQPNCFLQIASVLWLKRASRERRGF